MRKSVLLLVLALIIHGLIFSQKTIVIGGTKNQPPYTFEDESGIAKDIVDALNEVQNDYIFELKIYPAERARSNFYSNKVSILTLTNINWGFQDVECKASKEILKVKDKYFSLKEVAGDQSFFNKVGKEPTVVVSGFNYNFLEYNRDPQILEEQYNTKTVNSEPSVIKMILAKRGNIGVSSSTTLGYFSISNPEEYEKLLISDISDSEYSRHFIVRDDAEITVNELNSYITKLFDSGLMKDILKKYGL